MQKCLTMVILRKKTEERNASWPKIPEHPYINS